MSRVTCTRSRVLSSRQFLAPTPGDLVGLILMLFIDNPSSTKGGAEKKNPCRFSSVASTTMDSIMEDTIDLSEEHEVFYPNPDISLDVDDPAHFRADDDDHDIVPRASTPRSRSTTSEPPVMTAENKRKRSEDIQCEEGEPSAKRTETTTYEVAHIASAFRFPKTTDAAGTFTQVLQ